MEEQFSKMSLDGEPPPFLNPNPPTLSPSNPEKRELPASQYKKYSFIFAADFLPLENEYILNIYSTYQTEFTASTKLGLNKLLHLF